MGAVQSQGMPLNPKIKTQSQGISKGLAPEVAFDAGDLHGCAQQTGTPSGPSGQRCKAVTHLAAVGVMRWFIGQGFQR